MRDSPLSSECSLILSLVRRSFTFALLILLSALITFAGLRHFYPHSLGTEHPEGFEQEIEGLGPLEGGRPFAISPAEDLVPQEGKDFLLVAWMKLKVLPAGGGRTILFSKLDRSSANRTVPGYALAVSREPEGVRFWLYWNSARGYEWYALKTLPLSSKRWFVIALAYTDQRYISVQMATPLAGGKVTVELLGGYDLAYIPTPKNSAELSFGTEEPRERPQVGAVAVLHFKRSRDQLKDLLRMVVRAGGKRPQGVADQEVAVWASSFGGLEGAGPPRSLRLLRKGAAREDDRSEDFAS